MLIRPWMFLIIPLGIVNNFHVIYLRYYVAQCYTLTQSRGTTNKDKTDPLLNVLLNKFGNTFYPDRDVVIDGMLENWKEHS